MGRRRDRGDGGSNGLLLFVLIIVMYSCARQKREMERRLADQSPPAETRSGE